MRRRAPIPISPPATVPLINPKDPLGFYPFWKNEFNSENKIKPQIATAIGAWGDTLAAMGYVEEVLDYFELDQIEMIHVGPDGNISKFLMQQKWCSNCRHLKMEPNKEYAQLVDNACITNSDKMSWLPILQAHEIISGEEIKLTIPTNISYWASTLPIIKIPERPTLNSEYKDKARFRINTLREKQKPNEGIYILNPKSTQSTHWTSHWTFANLPDILEFLLEKTPHKYILIGQDWICDVKHPRLITLIDQLESMEEAFALCNLSDGIISSTNSLSMYSVVQNIPALIMSASGWKDRNHYFARWTDRSPNIFVEYDEGMEDFKRKANELFSRRAALPSVRRFWQIGSFKIPIGFSS